jgi:large subunit ribosomal protein L15
MIKLSDLKPSPGSTKNRKRVGRGPGSGHGKQSTQGGKGQKGGSGYKSRAWSEGGQMPIQRRVPKRGFHNKFRVNYKEINIAAIAALDIPEVTIEVMRAKGLATRKNMLIKVLGDGELIKPVTIKAHAFSVSAKDKIEKAGGVAEIVKKA